MKKIFFILLLATGPRLLNAQSVGLGTSTPDNSSLLELQSTGKGILIPRMTTAQRNSIPNPANGLLVYDETTESIWTKTSLGWMEISANVYWNKTANGMYNSAPGNVAIGTSAVGSSVRLKVLGATNPVDIEGTSPMFIGLRENGILRGYLGSFSGNNEDVDIGTSTTNSTGKLHLATTAIPRMTIDVSGTVGIGTTTPSNFYKLDVNGHARVQGELVVSNEITVNEVNRTATGTSNLVPLCYGVVNSSGSVLSGTGNFSATKSFTGTYFIQGVGFTANVDTDAIVVTPVVVGGSRSVTVQQTIGGINVLIWNLSSTLVDTQFSFIIYRL